MIARWSRRLLVSAWLFGAAGAVTGVAADYVDLAGRAAATAEAGEPGTALGDYAQAIELAGAADDRVAGVALLFRAAELVESEGQLQQALRLYERVLATLEADATPAEAWGGVLDELASGGGKVFSPRSRATVYPDLFQGTFDDVAGLLARPDAVRRLGVLACIRAGNLYLVQGQFEAAETLYRRGLAALGDEDPELARQIGLNRAWSAIKQGDLDAADRRLAPVVGDAVRGQATPSLRRAMIALAVNRREQGRTTDALRLLQRGIALHRDAGDDLGEARALAHLGSAWLLAGRPDSARAAYAEALALNRALDDREVALHATGGLARTLRQLGDLAAASGLYADYVARIQGLGATLATDQGKVSFLQDHATMFGEYVATALDLAGRDGDWVGARAAIETVRSRSLGPLRRYRRGADRTPPGTLLWQAQERGVRDDRMMVQSTPGLPSRARDAPGAPAGSHLALPEAFREQVDGAGVRPHGVPAQADTDAVGGTRGSATLLEYFVLPERTAIIVRLADGRVHGAVTALGRTALRERVEGYRAALGLGGDRGIGLVGDDAHASSPATRSGVDALARALHADLVGPVADLLPADPDAQLVVVPHDALWLLPFAALHDGDGYFGARHALVLASSEVDWRDGEARERPDPLHGRAWIVGNPRAPGTVAACGERYAFPPLPGAEGEAAAIAALFGEGRSDLFTGGQADRLRLDAWHGAYTVIHLATHGVVCPDRPLDSFVLLAELDAVDVTLDVDRHRLVRVADSRLPVTLRSFEPPTAGLSLPGAPVHPALADADWPQAGDPLRGFVYPGLLDARTLAERYRLDADLVTLSACQTGLGNVLGEGVIGLSRALLAAGARSVLLSLWRVEDAATEHLMVAFYRRYLADGDKALAFRQAMAETRERFPHPRDWAGFVLVGAAE